MASSTSKRTPQRTLLTIPFLNYLDTYHQEHLHWLQSFYSMTLLPQGLEVERLQPKDEDQIEALYCEYFNHLRQNSRLFKFL